MPAKLSYLRVGNFRRVKPGTLIEFGPQLNAVVGRNGTGKTTLLALISAIVRNSFDGFVHEEFEVGVQLVDGDITLEGTLRNDTPARSSAGNGGSGLSFAGVVSRGEVAVRLESDVNQATFTHKSDSFVTPSIIPDGSSRRGLLQPLGLLDSVRLNLTFGTNTIGDTNLAWLSGRGPGENTITAAPTHYCTRIREGVETFDALFAQDTDFRDREPALGITSHWQDGKSGPIAVRGHHLGAGTHGNWESASPGDVADVVTLDRTAVPLAQFVELTQYTDARLLLTKTSVSTRDDTTRAVFATPLARFTTTSGDEFAHPQLSFGEKRLLAFLIKLHACTSTIIVDELANGMHHSWLERAVELLEDNETQAFLTSQNPLLLDCLPLTRETYGRDHSLVVCELTSSGEMIWRNLGEAEREDLLRSLEVGLQYVSEVMRTKGLW